MANYDDDYNDDQPRRSGSVEQAKSKTQFPGILLIIMGVMSLIFGAGCLFASMGDFQQGFEAGIKQQIEMVEKNPQLSPEQKKAQLDAINKLPDTLKQISRIFPSMASSWVSLGCS